MPSQEISGESAMLAFGRACGRTLASNLEQGYVLFLSGEIGAGKTTLVRGILAGLGVGIERERIVVSPTYTLVEPYTINRRQIYHFDLYRVECPDELEMIGIRDMLADDSISLIEWPERAAGLLPAPDYEIAIRYTQTGREVEITNHNRRPLNELRFQ